jgi:hypothetical protein
MRCLKWVADGGQLTVLTCGLLAIVGGLSSFKLTFET